MKNIDFGKRLQQKRKQHGFSCEELANRCFINQGYLRQVESGEIPGLALLINICNTLEISPNYLFGFSEQMQEDHILLDKISSLSDKQQKQILSLINTYVEYKMGNDKIVDNVIFGKKLRALRTEKNMKVEDVVKFCGKAKGYIRTLEAGARMPSLVLLIQLCKCLQTTPNYLLGYYNNSDKKEQLDMLICINKLTPEEKRIVGVLLEKFIMLE